MAPPASKPSTRSTDPGATAKTKRKSESTHKSPTTPSISTAKKSPATTNASKPKTQLTLKTIKEQPKVTPVYNKTSTESTDITREIKKEKLDEAPKTPVPPHGVVEMTTPDEEELYSQEQYKETLDLTQDDIKEVNKQPNGQCNEAFDSSPKFDRVHKQGRGGRGGRTLVSQGRGGHGSEKILPPNPPKNTQNNPQPVGKTKSPINLTKEFEQKSKKDEEDSQLNQQNIPVQDKSPAIKTPTTPTVDKTQLPTTQEEKSENESSTQASATTNESGNTSDKSTSTNQTITHP